MSSPQTLSQADRRIVALWAADCAERVLGLLECGHMWGSVRAALRQLPAVGENASGPLGPGRLASSPIVADLQAGLGDLDR